MFPNKLVVTILTHKVTLVWESTTRTAGKEATWIQGMVNRRLDFLFFLSAQLFRASLLSFLYRSLDLKVSFTLSRPKGLLHRTNVPSNPNQVL